VERNGQDSTLKDYMNALHLEMRAKKDRVSLEEAYLMMAISMSSRSTCLDKQVGCIITNAMNEVIVTGYNGAPRGQKSCMQLGYCIKEKTGNPALCPSAHAEQNAILQCRVPEQIHTIYLTLSPCISCIRMIMNTPCEKIVFIEEHKHIEPRLMWKGKWVQW
jgi:dCMP deaminase